MKNKLKSVLVYGALAALCLATLPAFLGPRGTWAAPEKSERVTVVKTPAALDANPLVGVGRGADFGAVTEAAIQNAGGLEGVVKKGDVVLIKPNLCTYPAPDTPTTTDYRVVQRVVEMVKRSGASRVIIAEGGFTGNAFSKTTAARSRYDTITGVEFFDFNACEKQDCYLLTPQKTLLGRGLYIPKPYIDANVVIDVAKLKTHFQPDAVVSLSLKNAFGVPSERLYGGYGYKGGLHAFPLADAIVELNKIRRPDFSVIDGIVGGAGLGPANNTPVRSQVVFAGKDPVALDTVALTFMGFTVDQVPHVKLAGKEGLGVSDLQKITVKGADLDSIKMDFQSSFKHSRN
ncbi:MAG: DUF362 domain-containing protein [Spirochaetia bacterium]